MAVICVVSDDLKVMACYPTAGFMDNPRQMGVLNILAGLFWQESTDMFLTHFSHFYDKNLFLNCFHLAR